MNLKKTIIQKTLFVPLLTLLFSVVMSGCSDNKDELQGSQYGYVQFKLYKEASYEAQEETTQQSTAATRVAQDKLSNIQKVEIEMQYNGKSITQTLVLNSYNESNAEYGMRSDKLQLLVGEYKVVGYRLLNKVDEVVAGASAGDNNTFTVVSQGLTIKDLTASSDAVQTRGSVTFKLTKEGLSTRATDNTEYLFSNISVIDVTVMNTFTHVSTTIEGLKVKYEEGSEEHTSEDNPNDKYMDTGTAKCDSIIWLPEGTYQVTGYISFNKKGSVSTVLGTGYNLKGQEFTIKDNELTEGAIVPIQLSETAEYIKDYLALREIWKSLHGEEWGYYGIGEAQGTNWNFNKELDMWGNQPGVTLDGKGRVTGLTLEGFGVKGRVPDAIGQLTELQVLSLGSHSEKVNNGRLFSQSGIHPDMSDEQKQKMRMNYKETFLDYDPRADMSELLQDGINRNPQMKPVKKNNRITLKATQIGALTNDITSISKAVMRLTKLQQFYMGNSPFEVGDICTGWDKSETEYTTKFQAEDREGKLKWENMKELTDIELYNCKNLKALPSFLLELPELQLLNIACNTGISGNQLEQDWANLANSISGSKIQILYMSYNNLTKFPEEGNGTPISKMKKLGLLDCMHNKIGSGSTEPEGYKLPALGTDIKLATLTLDYNEIAEIPKDFCSFTDQVETLSFSHNKLKYIPNIFDASLVYVMGSVDFSYNEIGSKGGKNINCSEEDFKGINASTISLAYNQIETFPKELFSAGSPITNLNLSNNLLTEINEGDLEGEKAHLLQIVDFRFNKLTKLSDEFLPTRLPYLSNMDVSYNCFSKFPTEPLNSSKLKAFGIRCQRNAKGERTLKEWPEGITSCPSLLQLQIGGNDIRKVNEVMTPQIYILDIKDNPNISIDLTSVCPYIEAGAYVLIYDKTQDIRGCDALDIKR